MERNAQITLKAEKVAEGDNLERSRTILQTTNGAATGKARANILAGAFEEESTAGRVGNVRIQR